MKKGLGVTPRQGRILPITVQIDACVVSDPEVPSGPVGNEARSGSPGA